MRQDLREVEETILEKVWGQVLGGRHSKCSSPEVRTSPMCTENRLVWLEGSKRDEVPRGAL